jgi:selenocysteine-specific translation elongation factor
VTGPRTAVVAFLGPPELAKELGKKGTSSDITLYNLVRDGQVLTTVEPTQFPDKFPPLLFSIALADRVILVVATLDRAFAESVATLDLFDTSVSIYLRGAGEGEVRRVLKGSRFESATLAELDLPHLREELLAWNPPAVPDGPVSVRLDHAFPVKGVGTVALGFVQRGTLHAHDRLRLWPSDRDVEVRSIQSQDVDIREAGHGTRVGVALKGVDADEISRGQILAPATGHSVGDRLVLRDRRNSRYYRGRVEKGAQLQLLVGLQLVPARLESVTDERLELTTDRPLVADPGDAVWLADLSAAPGPRMVARAVLDQVKLDTPGTTSPSA